MGFGGSVAAMLTSLKNNKRDRKTAFDKETGKMRSTYGKFVDHKKLSAEDFAAFKLKMVKQKRRSRIVLLVQIFISICITLGLIIYFSL